MAWPSPRTWELASDLYKINLPIKPAVGESVALEFESYLEVYGKIPDLKLIIEGKTKSIKFPDEISCKWATLTGLITRCNKPNEVLIVFNWLFGNAGEEWIQLFVSDIVDKFEKKRQLANLSKILVKEKAIQKYMIKKNELLKNNLIMISKNDQLCDLIRATQLRLRKVSPFLELFPFFQK